MQNSLLDRIFPPSSPLLPQHAARRSSISPTSSPSPSPKPRHRLPVSGLSNSLLQSAPLVVSVAHISDPLLPVERAAKALEQNIQKYLDAQSEGLVTGLIAASDAEDVSSNGSSTPTPTVSSGTLRRGTTIPIRQPRTKKVTLRGARRGIARSMQDFAQLKQEEETILEGQIQVREAALGSVESLVSKRARLKSTIDHLSSQGDAVPAKSVRAEADELGSQIQELENKLLEMKARHRHLIDQANQLESSFDSKLSSYKASLELLEKDISNFLARPPILQPVSSPASAPLTPEPTTKSFYFLKPSRRTLEMAKEHWKDEQTSLKDRRQATQREELAFRAGLKTWREVVNETQGFEAHMRTKMARMSNGTTSNLHSSTDPQEETHKEEIIHLLQQMDRVVDILERKLDEVEAQDWKLLVCAIGAELEAFRQGRDLLAEAAGLELEGNQDDAPDPNPLVDTHSESTRELEETTHPGRPLIDPENELENNPFATGSPSLSNSREGNNKLHGASAVGREQGPVSGQIGLGRRDSRSESEDDDPGPDFLISHTS